MSTKFKRALSLFVLFITSVMAGHFFIASKNRLDFNCVSTFELPDLPSTFSLSGRTFISFSKDGRAFFEIDASRSGADDPVKNTTLRRKISFSYTYETDGRVTMTDFVISKFFSDNFSDVFFNTSIFDMSEKKRLMRITKTRNAYLISQTFSPVIMCVEKEK